MRDRLDGVKGSKQNIWRWLLIIGSILAAVKVIFVDYTLDEEYQIVMAYRRLAGDTLFGTMWEPHQTSAFACVWLMRLYLFITGGTTGVVLFLRFVTTAIQLGLAWWLVRVLERFIRREYAFCLGCCYFNMIPKIIQIPEFSNLQLWSFTILVLSLLEYEGNGHKSHLKYKGWLAAAGVGMALMVLAYPSSLLLFPFFAVVIFWRGGKQTQGGKEVFVWTSSLVDVLIFAGICAVCAGIWLWAVLSEIPLQEFLRNVPYILDFDLTHDVSISADYRGVLVARGMKALLPPLAVCLGMGALLWGVSERRAVGRSRGERMAALAVCLILSAEAVQLFYWIVLQKGYEEPQLPILVLYLGAALVWRSLKADAQEDMKADAKAGAQDGMKAGVKAGAQDGVKAGAQDGMKAGAKAGAQDGEDGSGRRLDLALLLYGIWGGILSILAVVYMSDLDAWYALPHGLLGALFAAVIVILALERQGGQGCRRWARLLVISLAACAIFGKGFTLRAGTTDTNTVMGIRGVVRKGPAAGIFTNYMQAYITNCTYEDFQEYVKEGEKCLIVTNMVGTAGTSPYLFRNLSVSHFSIVDPTSYDERLLTYWRFYPEKVPDVIVVDCWYGGLIEAEDSWIMRYIEQEFGYCQTEDGRYVRFYRRSAL